MKVYKIFFGDSGEELEVYDETMLSFVRVDESTLGFYQHDEWTGVPLTKWHDNIVATYRFQKCDSVKDYINNDLAWFLISEKFKDLLISLDVQNLKFLPLKVKCINQEGYDFTAYLCNVLASIDESAIDLEKSKYFIIDIPEVVERNNGRPLLCVSLCVLKSEMVSGHDIFRTSNSPAIYVSERVKKAIEKNRITGCEFQEIEVV